MISLDLGFGVGHMLAYDGIVFLDGHLVGHGALVLVGGLEVAGAGAGYQTNLVSHDLILSLNSVIEPLIRL